MEQSEPKILSLPRIGSKEREYHLYLKKYDWRGLTMAMKSIVKDVVLSTPSTPYTITILNDSHIGSNLIDMEWLCQMISCNLALKSLRISSCKNLLEFNKFHFLMQNGFLMEEANIWRNLEEMSIDSYSEFNDECFKLLINVIDRKCPSLMSLCLCRTAISNESIKELLVFLEKEDRKQESQHPLWDIDVEFCPQIDDEALPLIYDYLQRNPSKRIQFKCTGNKLFPDQYFEDQRLSISIYPT